MYGTNCNKCAIHLLSVNWKCTVSPYKMIFFCCTGVKSKWNWFSSQEKSFGPLFHSGGISGQTNCICRTTNTFYYLLWIYQLNKFVCIAAWLRLKKKIYFNIDFRGRFKQPLTWYCWLNVISWYIILLTFKISRGLANFISIRWNGMISEILFTQWKLCVFKPTWMNFLQLYDNRPTNKMNI